MTTAPVETRRPWSVRRKLAVGAAGLAAVLIVGGIAGAVNGDTPAEPSHPTVVSPAKADAALAGDRAYLKAIRRQFPAFSGVPDLTLLGAGYSVCDYWDEPGSTFDAVLASTVRSGFTAYEAGEMIGTATVALCPDQLAKIPG